MGSHQFNMMKVGVILTLIFAGSLAKLIPSHRELNEENVQDILNMVFCACDEGEYDGMLSLDEFTSEVCGVVNDHLFGYQVNQNDFEELDGNSDGQLSTDEVIGALSAMLTPSRRKISSRMSSNDVYVEAAIKVLGCSCDNDGSMSLSWEEVSTKECMFVQNMLFGQNLDENIFNQIDTSGDGNVDGEEFADALEDFFEVASSEEDSEEGSESEEDLTEENIQDMLNMVFCSCNEGEYDGLLSLDEFTGEVCGVILDHLFGYHANQDDFEELDGNKDGQLSMDEVFDALSEMLTPSRRMISSRMSSNNVHVEAAIKVLGCACDNDGSMSLSWEEVSTKHCGFVQNLIFGQNLDEDKFNEIDADGSGNLEGCEVSTTLEAYMEDKFETK